MAWWSFARCVCLSLAGDIMFWRWRWFSIGRCLQDLAKDCGAGLFSYAVRSTWYVLVFGLVVPWDITGWSRGVAVCEASLRVVYLSGESVLCDCCGVVRW